MSRHPLHRCALKFPRTSGEAFRDASYANPIERPAPKQRPLLRWAAISIVALVCMLAIAGGAQ